MFVSPAKTKLHTVGLDRKWVLDIYTFFFFLWYMRDQFSLKSRLRFLSAEGSISSCGRISSGYVVVINLHFTATV